MSSLGIVTLFVCVAGVCTCPCNRCVGACGCVGHAAHARAPTGHGHVEGTLHCIELLSKHSSSSMQFQLIILLLCYCRILLLTPLPRVGCIHQPQADGRRGRGAASLDGQTRGRTEGQLCASIPVPAHSGGGGAHAPDTLVLRSECANL